MFGGHVSRLCMKKVDIFGCGGLPDRSLVAGVDEQARALQLWDVRNAVMVGQGNRHPQPPIAAKGSSSV